MAVNSYLVSTVILLYDRSGYEYSINMVLFSTLFLLLNTVVTCYNLSCNLCRYTLLDVLISGVVVKTQVGKLYHVTGILLNKKQRKTLSISKEVSNLHSCAITPTTPLNVIKM